MAKSYNTLSRKRGWAVCRFLVNSGFGNNLIKFRRFK